MSNAFRELLKKVGSGVHTGKALTREEATTATRLMLTQEATPAQIGAFMIAHRIKRPTSEELAGMLDAYDQLGPRLHPWDINHGQDASRSLSSSPSLGITVLGTPYDGRNRTAPVTPLTALVLATAGVPVVMHGGDCMPTKYGVPLIEIWQGLGMDFSQLSMPQVQQVLETTGLGFIYLPQHFPQADQLVSYRDQIGKRPPIATMELLWSAYRGETHHVAGYVHPPTEILFRQTSQLRLVKNFTFVKGLEGSCDLPRDRTAIIAISEPSSSQGFERLLLHPSEYGLPGKDLPFESTTKLLAQYQEILKGKSNPLMPATIWNGGFYLWRCGVCPDLTAGLARAEDLFTSGNVAQKFNEIVDYLHKLK
ncbi:anthranilate phosphoribosyltransferase family protein [Moorena sp. SIO3I6]|uniref:anthranilate phosphoribosyltransferase family protein n=1 Tax=Moorena sp. SIO3I6 TaxID=2607831 RepID=UPI0013F7162A|nr:anthranilate phosphoribosyltransferase family protein [Moorena sp. SIO3I6]NEP21667.1 anthranilate phosphoribosyltransferase family protein [Moorena sp. SIO3I6]